MTQREELAAAAQAASQRADEAATAMMLASWSPQTAAAHAEAAKDAQRAHDALALFDAKARLDAAKAAFGQAYQASLLPEGFGNEPDWVDAEDGHALHAKAVS